MRAKKFISFTICAMLCMQMLPVTSLAAEVTGDALEKAPGYQEFPSYYSDSHHAVDQVTHSDVAVMDEAWPVNVTRYDDTSLVAEEGSFILGNGVKVSYDPAAQALTLYRMEGTNAIQMSKPSTMGYPIVGEQAVQDFTHVSCVVEQDVTSLMGSGDRMTITSRSASTGLTRTYVLETSDAVEGVVYTSTFYEAGDSDANVAWFVDNAFELYGADDRIWSYNGGGEGPSHSGDTLLKIDLTDSQMFSRENRQDYTAASIPVSDIYMANGGITIGDASATRREVHTPVKETADSAQVSIEWPGKTVAAGNTVAAGQSIVAVHQGDYFNGLRSYSNAMEYVGIVMPTDIPDSSYDLRWESWGWEFDWTVDLIIGKLDELEAAGVKQITLDDGWYDSAGDWGLNSSKFPNGVADMIRLTDAIHDHGMTAILWWRPCDGGENSQLYQEHPEYFIKNKDGSTGKLDGAGRFGNFFYGTGYALCPTSEGAIASQTAFIDRAMNEWGFDGFKGDFVWSMPKCYDSTHNHPYPEESTEKQSEFYRAAYEAMVDNDPDAFNLLCNCGTPQDYYSLQYVTQIATADPTSLDQTRRRVKAYKALMGDFFPVTTDHNDVWYPSTVGTGSVLIEKRAFTGAAQKEYERWLRIADELRLHEGRFIGDLYCYGFDPYETYVVEKDGVMYYVFYRDGTKYRPTGNPPIELKGLDPNKMYRIVDYVNDQVVATNLMGDDAVFNYQFSDYLLVKAVEITSPDPDPVDPEEGFQSVEANDPVLVYTGTWHDDNSDLFHGGDARYTSDAGASVELTFVGTGVRWYGQKDTNFGSATVYLDNELIDTVSVNGSMAAGQKLYEILDLPYGTHTIKIVCTTPVIDIDRFTYTSVIPDSSYITVEEDSENLTYAGNWVTDTNAVFSSGGAKFTNENGSYVELSFTGSAVRWYGQKDTNFGSAEIYLDGELVNTVDVNGPMTVGALLFEASGLTPGVHTIRIVCAAPVIDVDYFTYAS